MSPGAIFHRKSDVSDHQPPDAAFYEWNSPNDLIRIRLDVDTARRLGLVVKGGEALYVFQRRSGMAAVFSWDAVDRRVKLRAVRSVNDAILQ